MQITLTGAVRQKKQKTIQKTIIEGISYCKCCGELMKTYQQEKCKPCLLPDIKRANQLIDQFRGGAR